MPAAGVGVQCMHGPVVDGPLAFPSDPAIDTYIPLANTTLSESFFFFLHAPLHRIASRVLRGEEMHDI